MTQVLRRATPREVMTSIAPDLPGRVAPLWARGQNVIVDNGAILPIPADKVFAIPVASGQVRGMKSFRLSGVYHVFWGSLSRLFNWTQSAGTSLEGSGYAGVDLATVNDPATFWSFARWGEWVIATNGVDAPQVWKGSSFTTLSNAPATAELVQVRGPHVVFLNTDAGDNYAEISAEGNAEDYTTGVGKTAVVLPIRDLSGPIVAAAKLGGEICFYTPTSQHILPYQGPPYFFGSFKLQDGVGVCGAQAVIPVGRRHFGMDTQRCWVSDGSSWESISDHEIADFIFGNFNVAQRSKVVLEHMPIHHQVVFNWPSANSTYCDMGIPFNYKERVWGGVITRERSSADQEPASTNVLSGNRLGYLFDWSERDQPHSPSDIGTLPVSAEVRYQLGWKHGGWKQAWWKGDSGWLTG